MMEFQYISRTEVDESQWNHLVENHPISSPYFHTAYLDAVCDWEAIVSKDYQLIFPLPYRRKKGVNYIYTPDFVQQLGVLSVGTFNMDDVLSLIPKKYKLIELAFNETNVGWKGELRRNVVLDLSPSYEELHSKFSSNHKRNLKKVFKELVFRTADLRSVWELFKSNKGQSLNKFNEVTFEHLSRIFHSKMDVEVMGAYEGDELLTGMVLVRFQKRHIFLFSGNSDRGKELKGMYGLINREIEQLAGSEGIFDFEGSNDDNLARFYKGFGGREVFYPFYKMYRFPFNWIKK